MRVKHRLIYKYMNVKSFTGVHLSIMVMYHNHTTDILLDEYRVTTDINEGTDCLFNIYPHPVN